MVPEVTRSSQSLTQGYRKARVILAGVYTHTENANDK